MREFDPHLSYMNNVEEEQLREIIDDALKHCIDPFDFEQSKQHHIESSELSEEQQKTFIEFCEWGKRNCK